MKTTTAETELERAFNAAKEAFPLFWVSAQLEMYGELMPTKKIRISLIDDASQCYGANGSTVEEALKNLVAKYNAPKDEKLASAISLIQSRGYQIHRAQ